MAYSTSTIRRESVSSQAAQEICRYIVEARSGDSPTATSTADRENRTLAS